MESKKNNKESIDKKDYVLYNKEINEYLRDSLELIDEYVYQKDWRVYENANVGYSVGGLVLHVYQKVVANYWLTKVYPEEISRAHITGDFHIHDLGWLGAYCAGWSIQDIILKGFGGVPGKIWSKPPKHFGTVLGQLVNFLGTLQNEWAGAQAINGLDLFLAPYVYFDGLSYEEVKQEIQRFVYNLNVPTRWGTQTPFTNVTFHVIVPDEFKDKSILYAGKILKDYTYEDFQDEMDMINRAFCEVLLEGDAKGRPFTFPIPTYNITEDLLKKADDEVLHKIWEVTAKYGSPYFQNMISTGLSPGDVYSMCCRLQLNLKELRRRIGGIFGNADKTGSIGVVTINLPRIGYLSKGDEDKFFELLEERMELAKKSLEIKREFLNKLLEIGLLPYTKVYLGTFKNHFSTIGLVGMHEALLNMGFEDGIMSKEGHKFAQKVLDFMREKCEEFTKETGNLYNLEATPAEGCSYRLAMLDKKIYPDIITSGKSVPFYTNSTWPPADAEFNDIFDLLDHQEPLQVKYTGGTVIHIYLAEAIPLDEADVLGNLVYKIFSNYKIPYISFTPVFSTCPVHGYIPGIHWECPKCGSKCEVWARVVGYYRPVQFWNAGKREEFSIRKLFILS